MIDWRALLRHDKVRFLIAGGSTTAFSYLLYLTLLLWWRPTPAYVVAYVAGFVWAYSINRIWVFRGQWSWRGLATYPLVYLVQAVLSVGLFSLLVDRWQLSPFWTPLLIVVLMLPVNYWLGRWVVYTTSPRPAPPRDRPE